MLHLAVCSMALIVGNKPASCPATRASTPQMMPKFLKSVFPNLEKPPDGIKAITELFSGVGIAPPAPPITVADPSAVITSAGKAMPLLSPIFNIEADLQAFITNLGGYDEEAVQAEIDKTISSAPVVVYTYPLSPFSSEAVAILQSTGCKLNVVELGLEWFALGPKGSATRVELRKLYGQGSLPHVFIGGEWVGGLATGGEGGLVGLCERGELVDKLKKAKAV